jgi:hypothetical protein
VSKKKKRTDKWTEIFHDVLEPIVYFKLTQYEMRFIMVLWRHTYGMKGMKYKKASGKEMPWEPSLFVYKGGLPKNKVSDIKKKLGEDRIIHIKYNGTVIGYNKHWNQWKRDSYISKAEISRRFMVFPKKFIAHLMKVSEEDKNGYPPEGTVPSTGNKKSTLQREMEYPPEGNGVPSRGNSTAPKHCQPSASTAPKDKEIKGEIKLNIEDRIKIFEVFWKQWLSIYRLPASHKQSKPEALKTWTTLVNLKGIRPERILKALRKDKEWKFANLVQEASMQGQEVPGQYLPGAKKWLEDFEVNHLKDDDDGTEPVIVESQGREYTQSKINELNKQVDEWLVLEERRKEDPLPSREEIRRCWLSNRIGNDFVMQELLRRKERANEQTQ